MFGFFFAEGGLGEGMASGWPYVMRFGNFGMSNTMIPARIVDLARPYPAYDDQDTWELTTHCHAWHTADGVPKKKKKLKFGSSPLPQ